MPQRLATALAARLQGHRPRLHQADGPAALLQDHALTEDESGINGAYIPALTGSDWSPQHTLEGTIEHRLGSDTIRCYRCGYRRKR